MSYDKSNMKAIILFVIELVETRVKINDKIKIGFDLRNNINVLKKLVQTNFDNYEQDEKIIQKHLGMTLYLYEQHIKLKDKSRSTFCIYLSGIMFVFSMILLFITRS